MARPGTPVKSSLIREARVRKHWSQRDLAEALSTLMHHRISTATVSNIEVGNRRPGPAFVDALCTVLGLAKQDFVLGPATTMPHREGPRRKSPTVTLAEAARLLGLDPPAVTSMLNNGELDFAFQAGQVRIKRSSINRHLDRAEHAESESDT